MSMNDTLDGSVKLTKFTFDYVDANGENRQYVQESKLGGLRKVKLPFNFNRMNPDDLSVTVEVANTAPEEINDFDFFSFLAGVGGKTEENEARCRQSLVLKDLPKEDYFEQIEDDEAEFPQISYFDVTEKDMFGYPPMTSTDLLSNNGKGGIWGMHGLRKLEITVEGIPDADTGDVTERVNLYWYQRDGAEIPKIYETDIRLRLDSKNTAARKYIAYVNTNRLGKLAAEDESKHPEFSGRFEIHYEYNDEIRSYTFPIKICVHDTTVENGKSHLLEGKMVSIDFGTSSTCAAIKIGEKSQLFTLSGIDKRCEDDDNPYENPTNLMIYHWEEVYKQWQMDNDNCPFVLAKSKEHDEKEAAYDSGYTVDDEYKSVGESTGRRRMAAILTQLKLIPYLKSYGKEIKVTPYWGRSRSPITITDSLERSENGNQKFNPIAFYGYLLSRAINNPKNGKFYRNYCVTYPVKFDKTVREKIRLSLEYGIMRALPKPLRKAKTKKGTPLVTVKMEYAEPVACVGSIVGKQLQINSGDSGDKEAKLFAIYDLGGGTLDFAFGMFRPSVNDEELDQADYVIDILGIGGDDKVGGEKLIHKIAYKIYKDNKEEVTKKNIPFVRPIGELNPDGFEGLLSENGNDNSDTNVNLMKEKLARVLFKYGDSIDGHLKDMENARLFETDGDNKVEDATNYNLVMRDLNGKDQTIKLEVKEIDDFLKDEISSTIESFRKEMDSSFERNKARIQEQGKISYRSDDVYIFLSGNASKQHYVEELMKEVFKKNAIFRIGEGTAEADEEISKEYKLTEKTAVAFGQLELGDYLVYQDAISKEGDMPPFMFNVGYFDSGNKTKYIPVLTKNDVSREWHKANRIDRANLTTNLVYTTDPQCDPNSMTKLEEDVSDAVEGNGRTLYIRMYEEDRIEYRIGGVNDAPMEDDEPDETMVIKLKVLKD